MSPTPDEVARGDIPAGGSKKGCFEGLFTVVMVAVVAIVARKVLR